jgi:hypothetical protein
MLVNAPARQIAAESWEEFCLRFTDLHQGSVVSVQQLESGQEVDLFRDAPLHRLSFERTEGCSDLMHLEVADEGQKGQSHTITEPIHVKLYQAESGGKILRIDSESGVFLIRFQSGKLDELVEGLRIAAADN